MAIDKLANLRTESAAKLLRREYSLLRRALVAADWSQQDAARSIGCATSTMQKAVRRHDKLRDGLERHGIVRHRKSA